MNPVRSLLALLASASLSATAASLNLGLYQTVTVAGQSTLKKVDTTQPGQTLRQVAVAQTDKPLNTPRATIPVPANTTYAGRLELPKGASATFSLDGKAFSSQPLKTVTTTEDGRSVTRQVPAPENEYCAVRVTFGAMQVNTPYTVAYDIRVN